MSDLLPLSDWRCTRDHTADECQFERCENCGCCAHGKSQASGCVLDDVPYGYQCTGQGCGCEGRM